MLCVTRALVLVLALAALPACFANQAAASTSQQAILQDDPQILGNPVGTLARLRRMGVDTVRVSLFWSSIAPASGSHRRPRRFNATNPAAYPARNWAPYDAIAKDAQQDGIKVLFSLVGGAPLWATGPGAPRDKAYPEWEPSPREYRSFVRAVGKRYGGSYKPARSSAPLPRVSSWTIWNEPDYGPSLAPQGVPGHLTIENSPRMYRGLVGAAWSALHATGHGRDMILFGEVADRGVDYWGVFSGMKPLVFLRALYCVDHSYRELRGKAAAIRGCPTTAAGSRRFRAENPGLFKASGFSDHPYMRWYPPNREAHPDPDYSTLAELGQTGRALDRLQGVYHSGKRFPIYDTEFGYLTSPPKHPTKRLPWLSARIAPYYLNWAEYLSWRNPRVRSFDQYLLYDSLPALKSNDYGGFASGLLTYKGKPKPSYAAWVLPLYLPLTTSRSGDRLEVWGAARPAHFALTDHGDGAQSVQIQFQPRSGRAFSTLETVPITNPDGYFDVRVKFPSGGTVRLAYTYPKGDVLLTPPSQTIYSRHVQVSVH